jgi:hypothetical protein
MPNAVEQSDHSSALGQLTIPSTIERNQRTSRKEIIKTLQLLSTIQMRAATVEDVVTGQQIQHRGIFGLFRSRSAIDKSEPPSTVESVMHPLLEHFSTKPSDLSHVIRALSDSLTWLDGSLQVVFGPNENLVGISLTALEARVSRLQSELAPIERQHLTQQGHSLVDALEHGAVTLSRCVRMTRSLWRDYKANMQQGEQVQEQTPQSLRIQARAERIERMTSLMFQAVEAELERFGAANPQARPQSWPKISPQQNEVA